MTERDCVRFADGSEALTFRRICRSDHERSGYTLTSLLRSLGSNAELIIIASTSDSDANSTRSGLGDERLCTVRRTSFGTPVKVTFNWAHSFRHAAASCASRSPKLDASLSGIFRTIREVDDTLELFSTRPVYVKASRVVLDE